MMPRSISYKCSSQSPEIEEDFACVRTSKNWNQRFSVLYKYKIQTSCYLVTRRLLILFIDAHYNGNIQELVN